VIQERKSRVFVGVDDSLASLQALRQAAAEARQRHAELHVIYVRRPASPPVPVGAGLPTNASWWDPVQANWLNAHAMQIITMSLNEALGGAPADLDVHCTVLVGKPHTELASLSGRNDDLLVVGTDGGKRRHHPRRRSVSRYCATHSRCPVLVVPGAEFARAMRHRFMPGRSRLPRDIWKEFEATSRSAPRHVG
jgi:nucleotide-binding universal stress UspA family protein